MGKKSKNVSKQSAKKKETKPKHHPPKTEREQQVDDDERPQEGDVGDPIIELPLKKPAEKSVAIDEPLEIIKLRPDSFDSIVPRLSDGILEYLKSKSFDKMTPVQAATIPLFLTNKDVAVQAVTGSGKTLAFVIPIVEMLLRRVTHLKANQVGAIVLSPTRELAQQTFNVAKEVCQYVSLQHPLLLVGGHGDAKDDLRIFAKEANDIVVATPGRLEDVLTRYDGMDTSELEVLVLDEADVLLDMGFDQTLSTILARLPRMRRTGLFSATGTSQKTTTGTRSMKELMKRAGMRNPVLVSVAIAATNQPLVQQGLAEQATPTSLTNYYLITPMDQKLTRLVAFLQSHKGERIIVFFLTCACVEFWGSALQSLLKDDLNIEMLHGKLVQKRREKTMERFRETCGVLFCTDVAARGLDVSDVNWVIQFDAPKEPSSFVHRVGRSARAGRTGSSLLFLAPKEESYIDLLQNRKVPLSPLPSTEKCVPPVTEEGAVLERGKVLVRDSCGEPLPDMLEMVRGLCLEDRDILEKGTKAFTSYIRAYKEHTCAFIFRYVALLLIICTAMDGLAANVLRT
jgi:ATP-dependent RNA helicase DDX55/SPB4